LKTFVHKAVDCSTEPPTASYTQVILRLATINTIGI